MYQLTTSVSKNNFYAFLWHGIFLALAQNFMDVDTIVPSMMIDAGGNSVHIGLLTAIILGGSSFMQIVFSPYLNNKAEKKGFLILAIYLRVAALLGLGIMLYLTTQTSSLSSPITLIFILIIIFSLSGAFAAISYTDILGKSLLPEKRKSFFSLRQAVMSVGVFVSALFAAKILNDFAYPYNYSALFITASVALTIATFGFFKIKEVSSSIIKIDGLKNYLRTLKKEIKTNPKLRGYLLVVNTLGISLSLLPFLMLYSKLNFGADNNPVGQYLIFKVTAGVLAGLLIYFYSDKIRYKKMLYGITALVIMIPLHLIAFNSQSSFIFYFFIGGLVYTFYKVAIESILLEVSSNENRAIYAGLSGAGNIIPIIFPIIGGSIIASFGFNWFFALFLFIIFLSIYFIGKLDCKK